MICSVLVIMMSGLKNIKEAERCLYSLQFWMPNVGWAKSSLYINYTTLYYIQIRQICRCHHRCEVIYRTMVSEARLCLL